MTTQSETDHIAIWNKTVLGEAIFHEHLSASISLFCAKKKPLLIFFYMQCLQIGGENKMKYSIPQPFIALPVSFLVSRVLHQSPPVAETGLRRPRQTCGDVTRRSAYHLAFQNLPFFASLKCKSNAFVLDTVAKE